MSAFTILKDGGYWKAGYHNISRQETLKAVAGVRWGLYSTNKKENRIKNDSDFSRLSE